jgi:hypothetical protein
MNNDDDDDDDNNNNNNNNNSTVPKSFSFSKKCVLISVYVLVLMKFLFFENPHYIQPVGSVPPFEKHWLKIPV